MCYFPWLPLLGDFLLRASSFLFAFFWFEPVRALVFVGFQCPAVLFCDFGVVEIAVFALRFLSASAVVATVAVGTVSHLAHLVGECLESVRRCLHEILKFLVVVVRFLRPVQRIDDVDQSFVVIGKSAGIFLVDFVCDPELDGFGGSFVLF